MQLVAGSEIDTLFGAKLGLSTLAAAGLGNMVSDVAGVSMANRIEVILASLLPPELLPFQHLDELALKGFHCENKGIAQS